MFRLAGGEGFRQVGEGPRQMGEGSRPAGEGAASAEAKAEVVQLLAKLLADSIFSTNPVRK